MISYEDFLQKIDNYQKEKLPFVAFKYPNDNNLHCIAQNNIDVNPLCFSEKGFAFESFLGEKSFLLRADNQFSTHLKEVSNQIKKDIKIAEANKKNYKLLLNKVISEIKIGNFDKLVFSRKIEIPLKINKLSIYFERLIQKYASAFCYVFFHPKIGIWLAATPEVLLKVNDNYLETMSLAGTQLKNSNNLPKWGEKEKEEQQIVTQTINKELSPFVTEVEILPTETISAGNLWHLCTKIQGKITDFSLVKSIIKKLHPTPAVCGYPTEITREYIIKNEGYQRDFYSGFCGCVNLHNPKEIQLFVNLRCMQITENKAYVFVGGGITKDSDPEKEWQETQNKAQTMLQII